MISDVGFYAVLCDSVCFDPWIFTNWKPRPMELLKLTKLPSIVHKSILHFITSLPQLPTHHISPNSQTMAPLLKSLYRPSQRSLLSSLFTATFLGAVVVVAFPCPIRPTNTIGRAEARLDSEDGRRRTEKGEVVVLMKQRGRRFLEER
jgi:hypothetical protein